MLCGVEGPSGHCEEPVEVPGRLPRSHQQIQEGAGTTGPNWSTGARILHDR